MASSLPTYVTVSQNSPRSSFQNEEIPEGHIMELDLPNRVEVEGEIREESCYKRLCSNVNRINPCTFSMKLLLLGGAITGIVLSAIDEKLTRVGIPLFISSVLIARAWEAGVCRGANN